MKSLLLSLLVLPLTPLGVRAEPGDVRVRIGGIEHAAGTVNVALFAGEEAFEANQRTVATRVRARLGGVEVVFARLPPGSYSIAIFHDVNGNEKLDRNLIGLPAEPFGFSRNARARFGPPSFADMEFQVDDEVVVLEVGLQ